MQRFPGPSRLPSTHELHVRFTKFRTTLVASAVVTTPGWVHCAAGSVSGVRFTSASTALVASAVEIVLLVFESPQHVPGAVTATAPSAVVTWLVALPLHGGCPVTGTQV